MFNILGVATIGYLTITGATTNGSVIARGLVRAGRHLLAGQCGPAAVEALATVAAPAVMSYTATANLVGDIVEGAAELFENVLGVRQL